VRNLGEHLVLPSIVLLKSLLWSRVNAMPRNQALFSSKAAPVLLLIIPFLFNFSCGISSQDELRISALGSGQVYWLSTIPITYSLTQVEADWSEDGWILTQLEIYHLDGESGLPLSRSIWLLGPEIPQGEDFERRLQEPDAVVYQHWDGARLQKESSANFSSTYQWAKGLLASSETQNPNSLIQTLYVYSGASDLTGKWTLSRLDDSQAPLDIKEYFLWLDEVSLEITAVEENNPERYGQSFWRFGDDGRVLSLETRYQGRSSRKDFYTEPFDPESFLERYGVQDESS
jgi:hypothetical protein